MRVDLLPGLGRRAVDAWALGQGAQLVDILSERGERARRVVYGMPDGSLVTLVEAREGRWLEIESHDPDTHAEHARAALAAFDAPEPPLDETLPERPRLVPTVHARRHAQAGVRESKVILHEWRTGLLLEIDEASFATLELADGTRDLDALCLALARRDQYRGEGDLVQLLVELSGVGVLSDGLPVPAPSVPVRAPVAPLDRPLEVLEGFTLVCDGRGSCCRFYGSVVFTPLEARRARLATESMDLPIHGEELFTPVAGAQLEPDDLRAVALVDGRCAFLEEDGLCGLHRRGGPEAKPFPCRFYPAMLMDDGTSVRVSLGPECACIFASVGRTDGAPLVPDGARTLADLGSDVGVMHVPDPVPLTPTRTAPRAALAVWSRALQRRLAAEGTAGAGATDAVSLAWALADALPTRGLSEDTLDAAIAAAPPHPAQVAPWIEALSARADAAADAHDSFRSASDLSRQVARWIADALSSATPADLLASADDPAAERFYLRALAHGHRLAVEGRPLEHGLRDRAARILAARAMARVRPPDDTSAPYPLALLEAAMRNLGIAGYADDL